MNTSTHHRIAATLTAVALTFTAVLGTVQAAGASTGSPATHTEVCGSSRGISPFVGGGFSLPVPCSASSTQRRLVHPEGYSFCVIRMLHSRSQLSFAAARFVCTEPFRPIAW